MTIGRSPIEYSFPFSPVSNRMISRAVIALATRADPCPERFTATLLAARPYPSAKAGSGWNNKNACWYVERLRFFGGWKARRVAEDPNQHNLFTATQEN